MSNYDNIPSELKKLNQWVCWKSIENKKNPEKIDKRPIDPLTGKYAKSNDPDTWTDFKTAVHASQHFNGIGFMFANGYFGVDIDHVYEDIGSYVSGYTDNIVYEFIEILQSYAEYSVSDTGIHIIGKGKLPHKGSRKGKVEMYSSGRFFVMTGKIASTYTEISDCTEKIKPLHSKYIGEHKEKNISPNSNDSISEILNCVYASVQCFAFSDLYEGKWQDEFKSQSEADLSFCNMLAFWCKKDKQLMDTMYRTSGLMRDKWDRVQNGTTYGNETLEKAIRGCKEAYGPVQNKNNRNGGKMLEVIDAQQLQEMELKPPEFIIDGLISIGLHLLAAPPKYYKSWMMLGFGLDVSRGIQIWGRNTLKCEVLYLALEDNLSRLKDRMEKILVFDDAPKEFRYAIRAGTIGNGLIDQLEDHLQKYPNTRLIIIDTFQKVRGQNISKDTAYSVDYRDAGELKAFADKNKIALLVIHHLRKMADDGDPFNMISGTTGISGAVDTMMVMKKDKRSDTNTTLYATGRDIEPLELLMRFSTVSYRWELVSEDAEKYKQEQEFYSDATVKFLQNFITPERAEWSGTASKLLQEMDSSGVQGENYPVDATRMALRLNKLSPQLYRINISFNRKNLKYKIITISYIED